MDPKNIRRGLLIGGGLFIAIVLGNAIWGVTHPLLNGERIVHGEDPPPQGALRAEEIAESLSLPEGSRLLNTQLYSRKYQGVVTKEYSTDLDCSDVDGWIRSTLTARGDWRIESSTSRIDVIWPRFRTEYTSAGSSISVDCDDLRDFRNIKRFTTSVVWHND